MEHGLTYLAFALVIIAVIYAAIRGSGQSQPIVVQVPAGGGQQQAAAPPPQPQQNNQPVPNGAYNASRMGEMMGNMGTPWPRGAVRGRQWNGIGPDGIPYGGNVVEYVDGPADGFGGGNGGYGGGGVRDINILALGGIAGASADTADLAMTLREAAGATPAKKPPVVTPVKKEVKKTT